MDIEEFIEKWKMGHGGSEFLKSKMATDLKGMLNGSIMLDRMTRDPHAIHPSPHGS